MRKTGFFIVLLLVFFRVHGQAPLVPDSINYAEDSIYYLNYLEEYFAKYDEDKAENFIEKFRPAWLGSYYTNAEKDSIIALANDYRERRMQTIPHFLNYYRAILAFAENDADKEHYEQWHAGIKQMVNNEAMYYKRISAAMANTASWLNEFVVFRNPDIYWQADTTATGFTYQRDSLFLDLQTDQLTGYEHRDSLVMYDVEGRFNMGSLIWHGKEARVTWQKLGYPDDSLYAELGKHQMDLRWGDITDKSAEFSHEGLFRSAVEGKFEHKATDKAAKPRYPSFRSKSSDLLLKDIYPDVDFKGGIYLVGKQMMGIGPDEESQKMVFKHSGKIILRANAKIVAFGDDKMKAKKAEASVYFAGDSLHHPKVDLQFFPEKRRVELVNPTRGKYRYLFTDSRHNYDIDAELVAWNMDEANLRFESYGIGYQDSVQFRSSNFMSERRYQAYNNTADANPVDRMRAFSKKLIDQTGNINTPFTVSDVASYMKMYRNSAHQMMLRMKNSGFLIHHEKENYWTFAPEFFKYHEQLKGRADYDRIRFYAKVKPRADTASINDSLRAGGEMPTKTYSDTSAATLNVFSGKLQAYGVDSIPITTQIAAVQDNTRKKKESSAQDSTAQKQTGESGVAMKKGTPDGRKPAQRKPKQRMTVKKISVKPRDGSVVLTKSRNFLFDGQVNVGDFIFNGRNFRFDYENFVIDLDNVDYMTVRAKMEKLEGRQLIKNRIVDLSGYIELGNSSNRSGEIVEPEYPRFVSEDTSYVYYDDSAVMQIPYPREQVYFQIDPYEIDSMNRFVGKDLKLAGTFHSGEILPPIRDSLRIMVDTNYVEPDYPKQSAEKEADKEEKQGETAISFGFSKETASDGLPIYSSKATLNKQFRMSIKGLVANGTFRYRNATVTADDFEFTTSGMSAQAMALRIDRKNGNPAFPVIDGFNVGVRWLADKDTFIIKTISDPSLSMDKSLVKDAEDLADYSDIVNKTEAFEGDTGKDYDMRVMMYQDIFAEKTPTFSGKLVMTPDTLSGSGEMNILNSRLTANRLDFAKNSLQSEHLDSVFLLYPADSSQMLVAANMQANYDFSSMQTRLKAKSAFDEVHFPVIQYKTSMKNYLWDMKANTVDIDNPQGDLDKVRFVSTGEDRHGLSFKGTNAGLDIKNIELTVNNVDTIQVADAFVLPSTPVVLKAGAFMEVLENTRVHTQNHAISHEFYNSSTKIKSSRNYTAEADYTYTDKAGIQTELHFDTLYSNVHRLNQKEAGKFNEAPGTRRFITQGHGNIGEQKAPFSLSPNFDFFGGFRVDAHRKFLKFHGDVRPVRRCDTSRYFSFASRINPENINISLDESIYNEEQTGRGFYIKGVGIREMYSSFIDSILPQTRIDFLESNGYLAFNENSQSYIIYHLNQQNAIDTTKTMVALNKNSCDITGFGEMNFSLSAPEVEIDAAGQANYDFKDNRYEFNLILGIKFMFNKDALNYLLTDIKETDGLATYETINAAYLKYLNYLIPGKQISTYKSEVATGLLGAVPEGLKTYQLVLADLTMEWDDKRMAFVSKGDFAVNAINGQGVNRRVEGMVTIQKQRETDRINIDLKLKEGKWYYFRYDSEKLSSISSDETYNTFLRETRRRNRKSDDYEFDIGQKVIRNNFVVDMSNRQREASGETEMDYGTDDLLNVSQSVDKEEEVRQVVDQQDMMEDASGKDTVPAQQDVTYPEESSSGESGEVTFPEENAQEDTAASGAVTYPGETAPADTSESGEVIFEEEGENGNSSEGAVEFPGEENNKNEKGKKEEESIFEEK